MPRSFNINSTLTLALLLPFWLLSSGCHAQTALEAKPSEGNLNSFLLSSDKAVVLETEIAGCKLSIGVPRLWRDWQPVVAKPGPDGGSPLYVSVILEIENLSDNEQTVVWQAYVLDAQNNVYPVNFTDRGQESQTSALLSSGAALQLSLMAHDGPYLPINSVARLLMQFYNGPDREAMLATDLTSINKID